MQQNERISEAELLRVLHLIFHRAGLALNSGTSQEEVVELVKGDLKAFDRDYGLEPILTKFLDSLVDE